MKSYVNYQAADFAQDEYFQQWVFQPSSEASTFWAHWLQEHPEKEAAVQEARRLVLILGQPEAPLDPRQATRMKQAIFEQISLTSAPDQPKSAYWWRVVAACLVLLLTGGTFWGYQQWTYVSYDTPYGGKQRITLPDGSKVTLKANSRLQYSRNWSSHQDREVWLEGEAFFHVRRKSITSEGKQRLATFVVHATEVVDVAVLGTEFNVSTRYEETEVMLKSGSVRVEVKHDQPQTLLMEPGDLVAVAHRRGVLIPQQVDLQAPVDWQDNMLILDEVSLAEVAEKLQYTYGVEVVFMDSTLAQRKFKGFIPTDNLDVLLEAFTKLYDINIEQHDHQLIFSKDTQQRPSNP